MRAQRRTIAGACLTLAWLAGLLPPQAQQMHAQPDHPLGTKVATDLKDPLPREALQRFGTVRFRSGDGILSLAYSPDGKYLASGGRNDIVRLWHAETGQLVRTFKGTWVSALAFSPDGKLLATGGGHKVVRLWDVETGKELHPAKMEGHKATIKTLAFVGRGDVLVSGGDDGTVRVWKTADGSLMSAHEAHTFGVNALAVAPDNQAALASGSTDRTIRFWGDQQLVLDAPSSIEAVAYVDSKTVISAGDDGMVRVWDRDSAKETRNWKAHTAPITHMALSADGKTLVTGGLDKQLHVWDVPRATRLRSMPRRLGNGDALAMTANGKFVAIAGVNNTIERFDISTGKALAGSPVAKGAASALACSPGGNLLAAAFTNNQVQLIDFATGKQKHRLVCGSEDAEVLLAFAPDGQQLATVSAPDTTILWSTADGKEKQRLTLPQRDEVRCLAFGPGGNQLAVGYTNGGLRLWDARTGKVVKHIEFPHGVWAVAYAADGKTLAVGAEDAVTLFDTQTWQPARVYGKLHDIVPCLAFAPDGRHLAAGSFAGTIRLFDLTQPKDISDPEPRLLEGHQGVVNDIAWSANGRCLVSAGMDKTVRLWEFVNGQPIARWEGHQGQVSAVAFHPLGRKVVSASRDTTLLVWDVTLATPQEPRNLDADTLDQLWQTLASDNNPVANKALWTLTAGPRDSVAYLSKKVFVADPKKIEQCIRDLDSRNFKERQVAAATLASYGRWVEGVLRRALQDRPPEEVRQRIVVLLERLEGKNPVTFQQERLRVRRIIEALEQTITPAARALLQNLARGAAEEDLRDMAQAALKRMSSRLP